MKAVILAMAASLCACGASENVPGSRERYVNVPQGYSVELPDGWTTSNDRGSIRFSPPRTASKRSITIRSMPRPAGASSAELRAQTLTALRALPKAKMTGENKLDSTDLPGETFALTFQPPGKTQSYRRTHVLLLGANHIFHVIDVAPEGEPTDAQPLKLIASSLNEGG